MLSLTIPIENLILKIFVYLVVLFWEMDRVSHEATYNKPTYQKLQIIQSNIYKSLSEFQKYLKALTSKKQHSEQNTQKIHNVLLAFMSHSFKPLCLVFIFLEDNDIINLASTCKLAFKLIYSPLGYRLTINLRPIIRKVKQKQKQCEFPESALRNLSEDKSIEGFEDDEDDKIAILTTMKTKLIATKQKIKQLDKYNQKYSKLNQKYMAQLTQINHKREDYERRIITYKSQIQKFVETIHQNAEYIKKLKDQQQNVIFQKQNKITLIQTERQKLKRQKELLIKKITILQQQKKDKEIYTDDCQKVFNLIKKISASAKSHKK